MSTVPSGGQIGMYHTWSPQDLTKDKLGFEPIPDDDYIKRYQGSPGELWPVEFFLIAYRRTTDEATDGAHPGSSTAGRFPLKCTQ